MTTYKVIASSNAASDIAECLRFVKNVSLEAAISLQQEFIKAFDRLTSFPEANPLFNKDDMSIGALHKMIVAKHYIILYIIEKDTVVIHRVLDSRRKYGSM